MCQVSYCKVPSCAKGAQHMLHLRAKLPMSSRHCVPILPIVRCHRVPILPIVRCHRVPMLPIRMCQGMLSHGSPMCQVARLSVPRWPSQGAIMYQVAHRIVPSCAKLPIGRCHCVPSSPSQAIACQVAHRKVPLHVKLPIVRCHHVPITRCHHVPSCGMLPIARCHYVRQVKVSSCAFVAHRVCPKLCITWGAPRVSKEVIP